MDEKNERYAVNDTGAAQTSLSNLGRVQNILRSLMGDELISPPTASSHETKISLF